jgi:phospholipid-binding lipoprotein MlaA
MNYGLFVVEEVDVRSQLLPYDHLVDSAFDPYTFVRNAYLQNREFKVHGGASKSEQEQEEMLEQQADEEQQQSATPPPQHEAAPAPPSSAPPQSPPH